MLPLCRHKRQPDYNKLIPLVYAPALPLCELISVSMLIVQTHPKMFQTALQ